MVYTEQIHVVSEYDHILKITNYICVVYDDASTFAVIQTSCSAHTIDTLVNVM